MLKMGGSRANLRADYKNKLPRVAVTCFMTRMQKVASRVAAVALLAAFVVGLFLAGKEVRA